MSITLNTSDFITIDEEGLLPGTAETTQTTGFLNFSAQTPHVVVKFAPLTDQNGLLQSELKSKGVALDYQLSQEDHVLTANAGKNGPVVFNVALENDGTFNFSLQGHIDRVEPKNLLSSNWIAHDVDPALGHTDFVYTNSAHTNSAHTNLVYTDFVHADPLDPLAISLFQETSILQEIKTQASEPYQVSFYYRPETHFDSPIHLYWGEQLLHIFNPAEKTAKGYIFSVEGDPTHEITPLTIIGNNAEVFLQECLSQMSVMSTSQHKLPIDFGILASDNPEVISEPPFYGFFTVNVTTTPPIQINNHEPLDIYYEQTVYQTIVVTDQNTHNNPLTTINLDNLFKDLAIPAEHRQVEIVQREENGLGTDVYEVKIGDKDHNFEPITVADVQLSFPGGNGGLDVFLRNVHVEEGKSNEFDMITHDEHFI